MSSMAYVDHANRRLAEIKYEGAFGRGAVDGGALFFRCSLRLSGRPSAEQASLVGVGGHVDVDDRQGGGRLGTLYCYGAGVRPSTESDHDAGDIELCATLSSVQLRALERAPALHPDARIRFKIWLEVLSVGQLGLLATRIGLDADLSPSDWTRVLREMRWQETATFEAVVGGAALPAPLAPVAEHLRRALDLQSGMNWTNALGECRLAFDALAEISGIPPPPDWADFANRTSREAWNSAERIGALRLAARHLSHGGHHGAEAIGPAEARLQTAVTAALVEYYRARASGPW